MEEKSLFDRNIELLRKNYPRLAELVEACPDTATEELDCQIVNGKQSTVTVNGIQLTSRHDVVLQMEQMCAELNPAITTVDVYGHGLGDLGNYLLDNFKQLNQINFHILNLALFKILLSVVDFPLDNPKIRWIYENDQWEVKVPNVIYYPEVLMCDEQNRMLAEHLEGYLDLSYAMDSFAEEKARIIEQIRHKKKPWLLLRDRLWNSRLINSDYWLPNLIMFLLLWIPRRNLCMKTISELIIWSVLIPELPRM